MDLLELLGGAAEGDLSSAHLTTLNEQLGGLEQALGISYTGVGPAGATAELEVGEQHLQPAGLVHGGVLTSLGESVGSLAGLAAAGGRAVVGVNNSTDFISPVRAGVITAQAEAVQLGGRTQLWQVSMTHEGKLVARTTLRTMVLGH